MPQWRALPRSSLFCTPLYGFERLYLSKVPKATRQDRSGHLVQRTPILQTGRWPVQCSFWQREQVLAERFTHLVEIHQQIICLQKWYGYDLCPRIAGEYSKPQVAHATRIIAGFLGPAACEPLFLRSRAALIDTHGEHIEPAANMPDSNADAIAFCIGSIEPTASLRLPSLIAHFCHERPKVRLTVEVGGTSFVSQRVASGDLEVGICSPPPARLGLTFEPLFVEKMRLLLPADHPLTELEIIRPADLAGQRFLLTEPGCAYRRVIEQELFQRGINPYSGIEIGSGGALRRLVQLGVGVAIVPAVIASPLPAEMVLRDVEGTDLSLPVGLVRRAEDHLPGQVVEALLVALRTHLQEREKTST